MSEKVRSEKSLTPRQVRAIGCLMTAGTLGEAAKSAGISERQLNRWMAEPQFMAAVEQAQRQALDVTLRRLTSLATAATGLIAKIISDPTVSAAVRLRAADSVLAHLLKWREVVRLEERLAALEAALKAKA